MSDIYLGAGNLSIRVLPAEVMMLIARKVYQWYTLCTMCCVSNRVVWWVMLVDGEAFPIDLALAQVSAGLGSDF